MAFATAGRCQRFGAKRLPDPPPCTGQFHRWRYIDPKARGAMQCTRPGCGQVLQVEIWKRRA